MSVDSKLNYFDQKISSLNGLESKIELHSAKYLQQNLMQVLSNNDGNIEALVSKLKAFFDSNYMSKHDGEDMRSELHEKMIHSSKPGLDEDTVRKIVEEYLSISEKRQLEIVMERIREYIKEVQVHRVETGFDEEALKRIVAKMLDVYDSDKTGMVDYAMSSAGGQVVSTRCTELYQIKTKQYFWMGVNVGWWDNTSPRHALSCGALPGDCWAFQGFPGYLVVKTFAIIEVTGFSIEHMSKLLAVDGKIESAPKNFSVYGLRDELDKEPHLFGDYMYNENGTSLQYFPVKHPNTVNIDGVQYPVAYDIVELRIETNHGNPTYTCLYRFRVHGNPLNDIRRATEDSIRDSET